METGTQYLNESTGNLCEWDGERWVEYEPIRHVDCGQTAFYFKKGEQMLSFRFVRFIDGAPAAPTSLVKCGSCGAFVMPLPDKTVYTCTTNNPPYTKHNGDGEGKARKRGTVR